jgi:hypothetical protein
MQIKSPGNVYYAQIIVRASVESSKQFAQGAVEASKPWRERLMIDRIFKY